MVKECNNCRAQIQDIDLGRIKKIVIAAPHARGTGNIHFDRENHSQDFAARPIAENLYKFLKGKIETKLFLADKSREEVDYNREKSRGSDWREQLSKALDDKTLLVDIHSYESDDEDFKDYDAVIYKHMQDRGISDKLFDSLKTDFNIVVKDCSGVNAAGERCCDIVQEALERGILAVTIETNENLWNREGDLDKWVKDLGTGILKLVGSRKLSNKTKGRAFQIVSESPFYVTILSREGKWYNYDLGGNKPEVVEDVNYYFGRGEYGKGFQILKNYPFVKKSALNDADYQRYEGTTIGDSGHGPSEQTVSSPHCTPPGTVDQITKHTRYECDTCKAVFYEHTLRGPDKQWSEMRISHPCPECGGRDWTQSEGDIEQRYSKLSNRIGQVDIKQLAETVKKSVVKDCHIYGKCIEVVDAVYEKIKGKGNVRKIEGYFITDYEDMDNADPFDSESGKYHWEHNWLEIDGEILDPTADQFNAWLKEELPEIYFPGDTFRYKVTSAVKGKLSNRIGQSGYSREYYECRDCGFKSNIVKYKGYREPDKEEILNKGFGCPNCSGTNLNPLEDRPPMSHRDRYAKLSDRKAQTIPIEPTIEPQRLGEIPVGKEFVERVAQPVVPTVQPQQRLGEIPLPEEFAEKEEGEELPTPIPRLLSKFQGISWAGRNLHLVKVDYTKLSGEPRTIVMEPYSYRIRRPKRLEGEIESYAFGFDIEDSTIKGLIKSRIRKVEVLPQTFSPRWTVEI